MGAVKRWGGEDDGTLCLGNKAGVSLVVLVCFGDEVKLEGATLFGDDECPAVD